MHTEMVKNIKFLNKMKKEEKINRITRHLTACYRKKGLKKIGKYLHEPPGYRAKFYEWLITKDEIFINNWFNKIKFL